MKRLANHNTWKNALGPDQREQKHVLTSGVWLRVDQIERSARESRDMACTCVVGVLVMAYNWKPTKKETSQRLAIYSTAQVHAVIMAT
jgi:hypothetical protein